MTIASIITYISIFIWIFPALRQYRESYFYFFLVLALSDPVNIICVHALGVFPNYYVHSVAGLLLLYSIGFKLENLLRFWYANIVFIIFFLIALFSIENLLFIILFSHFLILIKFIKILMLKLYQSGEFNWFYLALIFYEITVILKVIVFISGTEIGILYFYLTLAFQFLVAIFFTIFREENSLFHFKLRTSP